MPYNTMRELEDQRLARQAEAERAEEERRRRWQEQVREHQEENRRQIERAQDQTREYLRDLEERRWREKILQSQQQYGGGMLERNTGVIGVAIWGLIVSMFASLVANTAWRRTFGAIAGGVALFGGAWAALAPQDYVPIGVILLYLGGGLAVTWAIAVVVAFFARLTVKGVKHEFIDDPEPAEQAPQSLSSAAVDGDEGTKAMQRFADLAAEFKRLARGRRGLVGRSESAPRFDLVLVCGRQSLPIFDASWLLPRTVITTTYPLWRDW
jgi:hypothetical protein